MKKIFISEPFFDKKDSKILSNCIKEGFVTFGDNIKKFESKISQFTGSQYCLICINGTSALQVALKVLGLKADEEVLAPSMTFVATINAILYNNAKPVFMDCENDLNIDTKKVIKFLKTQTYISKGITFNKKTKKRIRAIIIAHMYGNLANINDLKTICKKMRIKILEDAAESLGSFYNSGQHSGTLGDIGCFSFNGNKIITSGGGGALISSNKKYIESAKKLINQSRSPSIEYIHSELGYNYRITDLEAAVAVEQFKRLDKFNDRKIRSFAFFWICYSNNIFVTKIFSNICIFNSHSDPFSLLIVDLSRPLYIRPCNISFSFIPAFKSLTA